MLDLQSIRYHAAFVLINALVDIIFAILTNHIGILDYIV